MKISLAQQNYHIGNFKYNISKITKAIEAAKNESADLVVFSELAICGYIPEDILFYDSFLMKCRESLAEIASQTLGIAIIIGCPAENTETKGKKIFNAAYFIENGEIKYTIKKTCLPSYDIFDECRYFEPSSSWEVVEFKGKKIAVTICEDIWNLGPENLYPVTPMDKLKKFNPDFMVNLSASPFDYSKMEAREKILEENVMTYNIPLFYCNTVGAQTGLVFDGNSCVFGRNGAIIDKLNCFEDDQKFYNLEQVLNHNREGLPPCEPDSAVYKKDKNISQVYDALKLGISDYFKKMNFKKAILGSSGGLDSAVTLAIACDALGSENVTAVLLPTQYSSNHSVEDAENLSKNLNNPYHIIPVNSVYNAYLELLSPVFKNMPFDVTEENLQSRSRGAILMAIANKFGYILLNTSNKSEIATGYGTLYGDMTGGLSVLGDCYKTQVYEIASFINRNKEIIPSHIIVKPPSAELRPGQKDSDSLPDYNILDNILYQYIDKSHNAETIVSNGFDETLVNRVVKMVDKNEYKRAQFCPIIRVSSKVFGKGRRIPVVAEI